MPRQRLLSGAREADAAYLATEGAEVLGVLRHIHLLDNLTQRGTIAGAVLAGDAHLLRALRLHQQSTFEASNDSSDHKQVRPQSARDVATVHAYQQRRRRRVRTMVPRFVSVRTQGKGWLPGVEFPLRRWWRTKVA